MNMPVGSSESSVDLAHAVAKRSDPDVKSLLLALLSRATDTPKGCSEAAYIVDEALKSAGLRVEWHVATSVGGERFPVLIGWVGKQSSSPAVLLCAHLDTSPPGEGWTRSPYGEEYDGHIFGRGAVVSKSDVAVFIHAAKAAAETLRNTSDVSLAVVITCDEGSGGDHGIAYVLHQLALRPRVAIFAGVSEVVTIAHNGCVQFKVRLVGTACHQSLVRPREDAMRHATAICEAVYVLSEKLAQRNCSVPGIAFPTVNITKVVGGGAFGMSPREVEIWIDRRVTPDESLETARDEISELIAQLESRTDVRTEIEVVRMAEPMRPSPSQQEIVRILQSEAKLAFGKQLRALGSTLYTDARWYSNAGIPTVMFGAGEADIRVSGANGSDERVPERCLGEATVILARSLVAFCGTS